MKTHILEAGQFIEFINPWKERNTERNDVNCGHTLNSRVKWLEYEGWGDIWLKTQWETAFNQRAWHFPISQTVKLFVKDNAIVTERKHGRKNSQELKPLELKVFLWGMWGGGGGGGVSRSAWRVRVLLKVKTGSNGHWTKMLLVYVGPSNNSNQSKIEIQRQ